MSQFLAAQAWLNHLESEAQFFRTGVPPSLDVVEQVLDALGRPDESFVYRIIIGGTAGKGTVCRLTEDVLLRSGKSVVTLISPHVQVITERIRINGQLISREDFGSAILQIKKVSEQLSVLPTYYEAIVCAGIWAGKKVGCEMFLGEIGMGGRLDWINSVRGKRIAAVTFIGEDHLEHFDGKLENLAREKAGIFTKDCVKCFSCEQNFRSIFDEISNSKIQYVKGVKNGLNKKIARKICENLLAKSNFEMRKISLPCRWEKIKGSDDQFWILDGAHSAPRFEYILPKLKKITGKKSAILGLGKNHDPESFRIILDQFDEIFWVPIPGGREAWSSEELKSLFQKGMVCSSVEEAITKAQVLSGTIFVNSFFLSGEVRNQFYDPQKILEQQTEFPA